eukprot:3199731-Amphidinium_carterae.1
MDKKRKTGWMASHAKVRKESNISEGRSKWTERNLSAIRGIDADDARALDVIDLCFQVGRATGRSEVEINQNAIVDVSQDGERQAWSFNGVIRSLTTSSETFIFKEARTMQPVEHLLALGFANPVVTGLSASKIRDLAGEAMPLPPIAICAMALLTSLPGYWEELSCLLKSQMPENWNN